MLICQISDLHIKAGRRIAYGVVDTSTMLERCVASIRALDPQPDVIVATGDLVDRGRADEYHALAAMLAPLHQPLYLIPGNHDQRDQLRASFPDHGYLRQWEPFVQYAIDDWPVRIVALDTVIPQQGGGALCAERLAWLERTLALAPDQPTVIVMHHPPFRTGIGHMDAIGIAAPEAEALAAIVARYPNVERVLCGHLHRAIEVRFGGTIASTCPSPAHLVALDLRPGAGDHFMMEPPGFQLHWWDGARIVTHLAYIGDYDGPYPFRDTGELID